MKYRVNLIYFCVDCLRLKMFFFCKYYNNSFIYETSCLHSSVSHMHMCVSICRAVRRCFCVRSVPSVLFMIWPAHMFSSSTFSVGVLPAGLIFRYSSTTSLPTASHDPSWALSWLWVCVQNRDLELHTLTVRGWFSWWLGIVLDLCKGVAFFHTDVLDLVTLQFHPGSNHSMDKNVKAAHGNNSLHLVSYRPFRNFKFFETDNKESVIKIIDT